MDENLESGRLTFFMPKVYFIILAYGRLVVWDQNLTLSATIFVDEGFAFFSSFLGGMTSPLLPDRECLFRNDAYERVLAQMVEKESKTSKAWCTSNKVQGLSVVK